MLLAACTSQPSNLAAGPSASSAVERTSVTSADADTKVTVVEPELAAAQETSLKDWADFPVAVGKPVEIASSTGVPAQGVTITRSYARPLPEDATATLAYYAADLQSWLAVPSTVSGDRRSVSALVNHLSLWTDIVSFGANVAGAVQQALASASDWAYYNVGKIFDVRVDAPSCDEGKPEWLSSVVVVEANRNNSILFCTGIDKKLAGVVVAKARVNRGFGFIAKPPIHTAWTYNSTFDHKAIDDILTALSGLDEVFARSFRELTAEGLMVGPGEEFSLGLTESDVRASPGGVALQLDPQSVLPYLWTTLGQLVGTDAGLKADGYVGAIMATAKCAKDIAEAKDGGTLTKAAISCVTAVDEALAKQLANYLLKRGVKDAGAVAGKIVGKLSVYLALIGPIFNGMNYWAERAADLTAARTVTLFPSVAKKEPTAVLPAVSPTANAALEVKALLVRTGFSPVTPISADCEGISVLGADFARGDADLVVGASLCDGDPISTWYRIRSGGVVSTGWASVDAGIGDVDGVKAFLAPYSQRRASWFVVVPGANGWELSPTT